MGKSTPLYRVEPLESIDVLVSRLSEKTGYKKESFQLKGHIDYFNQYFPHIIDKSRYKGTILTEYKYIDKDYLEDYQNYYVRCFKNYKRKCTRIHFFNLDISEEDFENILTNATGKITTDEFVNSYLGFIIAKPLPSTIIGKTCLTPYPEIEDGKNFKRLFIKRKYNVNLFGIELSVESLGFQEQDHIVAACATTALFTAFQGTSTLFNHQILTPSKITQIATHYNASYDRILPSNGLTHEQMAQAIKEVGLECDGIEIENKFLLTSLVNAYLKLNIPLILTVTLVHNKQDEHGINFWEYKRDRTHAVTITGYRKENNQQDCKTMWGFNCDSNHITKVYAHDDQVGPYARMELVDKSIIALEKLKHDEKKIHNFSFYLTTSLLNENGEREKIIAIPKIILAPLYHKIRISLNTIHQAVKDIDDLIRHFTAWDDSPIKTPFVYKVYITRVQEFKKEIFNSKNISGEKKKRILTQRMPKYLWRVDAFSNENIFFSIIFDATDLEQGNYFLTFFDYEFVNSPYLTQYLIEGFLSDDVKIKSEEKNPNLQITSFLKWFKANYSSVIFEMNK